MTTSVPRVNWDTLDLAERAAWVQELRPPTPVADVAPIVDEVRTGGDAALRALTRHLDGADLDSPWLDPAAIGAARVEPALEDALVAAANAIRRYHADQRDALRAERRVRTAPGIIAWRRWLPIERVGAYVPGGLASYASSVLMVGVPAALAGVDEIVIATPPDREGRVAPSILVAARIAGVHRILRAGGAQAIAALAHGTESVPRVDKIFGAGNAYVTAAKRLVSDVVAIDLPAGPSECVVVADGDADVELVALDLLAQSEHGPDSVAILVTDATSVVEGVAAALPRLAADLATGDRALETLGRHGRLVLVPDIESGIAVVNAVAAEHVSLQCADAERLVADVRHAGAIFIGPWSPIAGGDYATGTNHVLPTGGAARAWSGVGVESFGRWIEVQRVTPAGVRGIAPTVAAIAAAEGLAAHGASVTARAERAAVDGTPDDPVELLRRPEAVAAYPAEPSDEELAERAGIDASTVVRADMNTLGGGALDGVRPTLSGLDPRRVAEYGDLAYAGLRRRLAERLGVAPGRIVPGAGADELIRLVTTAVVGAGDPVVIPTPTFAMFAVEAQVAGARVVAVPRADPGQRQSIAEIRAAAEHTSARLVWLCTPNNPTGDAYSRDEVRQLAEGLQAIVCVDEVYLEFGEDSIGSAPEATSAIALQDELRNVLVLRSLAKSHGLAGARVGYLVVPPGLEERFDAIRLPLSVGSPSEAIAMTVLADDGAARERRRAVIEARDRLSEALESSGARTLPSVTNFVAFRPATRGAADVDEALLARGVAVRRYDSGPMAGWLRATARLGDEETRLLAALQEVLQ